MICEDFDSESEGESNLINDDVKLEFFKDYILPRKKEKMMICEDPFTKHKVLLDKYNAFRNRDKSLKNNLLEKIQNSINLSNQNFESLQNFIFPPTNNIKFLNQKKKKIIDFDNKFKCLQCHESFSKYQSLGGHMGNHSKSKYKYF